MMETTGDGALILAHAEVLQNCPTSSLSHTGNQNMTHLILAQSLSPSSPSSPEVGGNSAMEVSLDHNADKAVLQDICI